MKMIRRSSISLKANPALTARRVILDNEKIVYLLVASKPLHYPSGKSRIAYIGTTKKGGSRIASSVATRESSILNLHGVTEFEARVITCKARQRVKMWIKLERALLLSFRDIFGEVPRCNTHGKGFVEEKEFEYFARNRVNAIIRSLS
ncbi:hypothetical protein [Luteimonas abyssi]|uniref:hypothetical protein n=1 Tax=Luteimonas abyssi TaxID=1247514 RepID=UPI0012F7AEC4|nr:hypothetical protein [Luteimonas abyssi]